MTDFTKFTRKELEERAEMYQRLFLESEQKVEDLEDELDKHKSK